MKRLYGRFRTVGNENNLDTINESNVAEGGEQLDYHDEISNADGNHLEPKYNKGEEKNASSRFNA